MAPPGIPGAATIAMPSIIVKPAYWPSCSSPPDISIMVIAPGIPGGAIMAALGLLQSMLGFDETAQGWMITLYIAMDSFGTATNVTVAGDIAIIVNRVNK